MCLVWDKQGANPSLDWVGAHNHCRNPTPGDKDGVWCFTGDMDESWGYCEVRKCKDCDKGKKQAGAELCQA